MTKKLSVREIRNNLATVLDEVAYKKDTIIITSSGKEKAALIDIEKLVKLEDNYSKDLKEKRKRDFLKIVEETSKVDLFPEVKDSSDYVRALRSNWR